MLLISWIQVSSLAISRLVGVLLMLHLVEVHPMLLQGVAGLEGLLLQIHLAVQHVAPRHQLAVVALPAVPPAPKHQQPNQ